VLLYIILKHISFFLGKIGSPMIPSFTKNLFFINFYTIAHLKRLLKGALVTVTVAKV